MHTKPKIVILGAGYAGIMTTKRLTKYLSTDEADIVLINKHNYHYQTTWLHEVAAGTIHHNQARIMISDVINPYRVRIIYDTVLDIKKEEQRVVLDSSEVSYDYLVVALGFETNTYGIEGMDKYAFFIQDFNSSRLIREQIEFQFAKYNDDKDDRRLTILVGGAGFTGIEFVGELVEQVPKWCQTYDVDHRLVRIINVEASPSILPGFDEDLVSYAKRSLENRGVQFYLNAKISECRKDGFIINDDEEIKAGTTVWTGGVTGNSVLTTSGFELNRGKVSVNNDLRMPGEENIFVLGDCSWVIDRMTDRPYSPTAQLAMQEADVAARNLRSLIVGGPIKNFVFNDKGTVASLGNEDAIGTVFSGRKLYGTTASMMKKIVDNRYLFLLGGPKLVLKKGKLNPF